MFTEELLTAGLAQPRWPWLGLAHLGCDRSGDIVAHVRLEVCDGAHRAFVMNRGSPFRYLPASKQVEIVLSRRLKLSCEVH